MSVFATSRQRRFTFDVSPRARNMDTPSETLMPKKRLFVDRGAPPRPSKVPRLITSRNSGLKLKSKPNDLDLISLLRSQKIAEAVKNDDFPQMMNEIQDIFMEGQKKLNKLIEEILLPKSSVDQGMIQHHISNADISLNDQIKMQLFKILQSHVQSEQKSAKVSNTETLEQYSDGDKTQMLMLQETNDQACSEREDKICQTELLHDDISRTLFGHAHEICQTDEICQIDEICQTEPTCQKCFQDISVHSTDDRCDTGTVNIQNCYLNSETSSETPSSEKEDLESPGTKINDGILCHTILKRKSSLSQFTQTYSNDNSYFESIKYSSELFSTFFNQLESYHHLASVCTEQFRHAWEDMKQRSLNMIKKCHQSDDELISRYEQEMALRKKYHNELMKIKGNIRVFCRIRPPNSNSEDSNEDCVCISPDKNVVIVKHKKGPSNFELSLVFPPDCGQSQVFEEVISLITSCIDGFNVCIVAYGQTGSGKTYTMEGTLTNPGINPRALDELFKAISAKDDWIYSVYVSMLEIYNEQIRDLLSTGQSKVEVRNIEGENLVHQKVNSVFEVNELYSRGKKNRVTAATNMNSNSSRSHTLLLVEVEGLNTITNTKTKGKLYLIDLAGSENVFKSGVDGQQLKEAGFINKSLSTFCDVINAILMKKTHIPFRNSKLTHLLQDSLGGNSKTLLITQISPNAMHLTETLRTLQFAQRLLSMQANVTPPKSKEKDPEFNEDQLTDFSTPNSEMSRRVSRRLPSRCASLFTISTPRAPYKALAKKNMTKHYQQ